MMKTSKTVNKLSLLLVVALLFSGLGCSFSKPTTKKNQEGKVSQEISVDAVSHDKETGADRHLHQIERELIRYRLFSKENKLISEPDVTEDVRVYRSKIEKLMTDITEQKLKSLAVVESEEDTCIDISLSLVHDYMLSDRQSFSSIADFLMKQACYEKIPATDLFEAYQLEARRQFQTKFADLSLLKFLLNHSNFKRSTLIPLGKSGVSISLKILYRIWQICDLREISDWNRENDYSCMPAWNVRGVYEKEAAFLKELGVDKDDIEMSYIEGGKLIVKTKNFPVVLVHRGGFVRLLMEYMTTDKVSEQAIKAEAQGAMLVENNSV